jgi:protein tyrosine phosphatase (PTP) superfamily phosphohydrolase (DUF442 family)
MKKSLGRLVFVSLLVTGTGCCNAQRQPVSQPIPPPSPRPVLPMSPAPFPPPGACQPAPPPYPTVSPGANIAPAAPQANPFPSVPPGGNIAAPAPPTTPFPTAPPPVTPNNSGAGSPPNEPIARVENRWEPADAGIKLGAPEPIAGAGPKTPPSLYPPDKTPEPPTNKSATTLPVGIPQFATAMDNVATGLRPSLDDGLDWLQARGYRTVVHIHLPDENDGADRKQVEKRGMKYMGLEVSPQTLTIATVREFSRAVRDTSGQPVFLYDRDGSLAGGLWYLHFRTVEQISDEVARIRAGSLGLREDRDGTHRDMWLAVQKYLNDNPR